MMRKLWSPVSRGDGEDEISQERARAYDEVDCRGWDVRCKSCGAEFRLLYTIEEWGKMSDSFFPVIFAALDGT
jgi:hypothetical protein